MIVDDDPIFLESFTFHFGEEFPCVAYTQPERAIEHVRSQEAARRPWQIPSQSASASLDAPADDDRIIRLDGADLLAQLAHDPNRFRRVGVAVVDYDMPSMTGIEFCRAIRDLPVRKLLLTGKAGVDTAIEAFNEGLIDVFLTKHDPNIQTLLPRQVRKLQNEYFRSSTQVLAASLNRGDFGFLADTAFEAAFADVVRAKAIVEHYVGTRRPGALMLTAEGQALYMAVAGPELIRAHIEIAELNHAPAQLIEWLRSGSVIPLFEHPHQYYEGAARATWQSRVFPASVVPGREPWRYAIVRPDQVPSLFPSRISSYRAFLDRIETPA
jgi:CheY-like chemotaxis protein